MSMNRPVAKALDLRREGTFGLLLVLTALLGWVVALGGGGATLMQEAYRQWSLERQQTISLYLPAESEPEMVNQLAASLATEPGVVRVEPVATNELQSLLAPYGDLTAGLPVPVVLDVQTAEGLDRAVLEQRVRQVFPTAEVDDARALLQSVARGIRLTQTVGVALAVVMVVIMLGLVVLTVRVGLQAHAGTLRLLRQLGAADGLLVGLVSRQVMARALTGWLLAAGGASLALGGMLQWWPVLQPLVHWPVWLAVAAAPMVLPVVAWVSAVLTTRAQLRQMV